MNKWKPVPGAFAYYVGRTRSSSRMVRIVAEASGGYMCVEAIGRQGRSVRLSVKKDNLREPDRDLFD